MKKKLALIVLSLVCVFACALALVGCHPENATYYLMENGKLKTEQYFKLNSGKWEDDDGASGTYKTEDGKIRLYIEMFGEKEELVTGTYGDGLLIFDMGGGMKEIYVSDAHGHTYGEWKTVRHNCVEDGLQRRTCVCGFTEEQTTTALRHHTFGEWETFKYNCLEDGLKKRYCACGEEEEEILPAIGSHTFGDWVVTPRPETPSLGVEERVCVCGESESRKYYFFGKEFYELLEKAEQTQSYSITVTINGVEYWYQIDNGKVVIDGHKRFLYKEGDKYVQLDYDEVEEKYRKTFIEPFDCNEFLELFKKFTLISYDDQSEEYTVMYDGKNCKLAASDTRIVIDDINEDKSYKMEAVGLIEFYLPDQKDIIDDTAK